MSFKTVVFAWAWLPGAIQQKQDELSDAQRHVDPSLDRMPNGKVRA
ncbi:hypothetical protein JI739_04685 [Ramlibacter sp. AW1]|uniref:Uncharacterized protein n=1 Tax=Ramlibacter aurantiacus TaxID=2801330 RepID=A0A936ZRD1_9BURK|nr:hypothetical protein [Ramlibacter aurantiacus]MBL0419640.1 hypothetical protein [Ramlibacter aurantiacus]